MTNMLTILYGIFIYTIIYILSSLYDFLARPVNNELSKWLYYKMEIFFFLN